MRIAYYGKQFKKDYKKEQRKQGKNFHYLKEVMTKLMMEDNLDEKHQDHQLKGSYKGRRELHIKPDWLLIYRLGKNETGKKAVYFERTGSHSDLFD